MINNFTNTITGARTMTLGEQQSSQGFGIGGNRQQALVYIDVAALLRAYVDGCKQMFELGVLSAKLGDVSSDQVYDILKDDEVRFSNDND